ncbi:MAG TPA: hypothetical protein VK485_10705 [Sphingomicrobium sp.]|nr:hypothetical protein [Sphingomicrobium sp.]
MRSRSFRSVGWVATVAGAALGCYLVSLRVASERAALEDVETKIVMTQRDIRLLQTEIGTRGRLAQLERWNVKVLALSAPSADQFVEGGYALAKLTAPEHKVDLDAPVVLASAPVVNQPSAKIIEANYHPDETPRASLPANGLMHQASLKQFARPETAKVTETPAPKVATPAPKPAKTATATKPAMSSGLAATGDPLAPLPGAKPSAKAAKPIPVASATSRSPLKDSGQAQ